MSANKTGHRVKKNIKVRKSFAVKLLIITGFLCFSLIFTLSARAQTACDPHYMDALEARAWLEAQREISQNQNLILKPDSVLEYTCFDRLIAHVARNFPNGRQFSETRIWEGIPIPLVTDVTTDLALNEVAGTALVAYLSENFSHGFLSGRVGLDYEPDLIEGNRTYVCDRMALVWDMARCMNFHDREDLEGFFDFAHYSTNDPRQLPSDYAACEAPRAAYNLSAPVAFNNDEDLFILSPENTPVHDPIGYNEDIVQSFVERMSPGNCNGDYRIPTGVRIVRERVNSDDPYNEYVCTQPGCSYVPTGLNTGNCVP